MATAKENITAVKFLQDKFKAGEKVISSKDLDKIGIEKSQSSQQFRNIQLKKDFFGEWAIKLVDDTADLDGTPIAENKKLISRLKALWENDKKEMKYSELKDMNICTPATSLKILNFKLTDNSFLVSSGYYDITLIDNKKILMGFGWTV